LLVACGLENGLLTDSTKLLDKQMGKGHIHNYSNEYWGLVRVGFFLRKSLNTAIDNYRYRNQMEDVAENILHRIFGNELQSLPADWNRSQYVLGQPRELNLIQIASMYRSFLHTGTAKNARLIQRIIDANHFPFDTVYKAQNESQVIFSNQTVNSMQELLKEPLKPGGTLEHVAQMLNNDEGVVGKSGTSDKYQVGYTVLANSNYLIVVRMCYQPLRANKELPAIPYNSGGHSAGAIAGILFNLINN
jgi:membrane peptidoglycan carboxypeptidase